MADGTYQTRVIATDSLGHQTISATITLIIDNTHPTATSVNAANGGTAGRIDAGDTLTFTWSEPMAPASILSGWAGGAQPIRIRVNDAGAADTLDLYDATGTTKLNVTSAAQALRLNANWVANTVWLDGSMTMTGNGIVVTVGLAGLGHDQHRRGDDGEPPVDVHHRDDRPRRQLHHGQHGHRDRRYRPRLLARPTDAASLDTPVTLG